MTDAAAGNILVPDGSPPPGDFDSNGMVRPGDCALWKPTFGQLVSPGTGADGNTPTGGADRDLFFGSQGDTTDWDQGLGEVFVEVY